MLHHIEVEVFRVIISWRGLDQIRKTSYLLFFIAILYDIVVWMKFVMKWV